MRNPKQSITLMILMFQIILLTAVHAQQGFTLSAVLQPQSVMTTGNYYAQDASVNSGPSTIPVPKLFTSGVAGGIVASHTLTDKLSIIIGLLYSSQGQKYGTLYQQGIRSDGTQYSANYSLTTTLNYLKIPIEITFTANPEKTFSFTCYEGFYFGYLLDYSFSFSETEYESLSGGDVITSVWGSASGSSESINYNFVDVANNSTDSFSQMYMLNDKPFNAFDLGVTMGAGVQIRVSDKIYIPVLLKYDIGLLDIKNKNTVGAGYGSFSSFWGDLNDDPNQTTRFHNSTIGIGAGMKIVF